MHFTWLSFLTFSSLTPSTHSAYYHSSLLTLSLTISLLTLILTHHTSHSLLTLILTHHSSYSSLYSLSHLTLLTPSHVGVLCGECRESYGVGMLTMECRKFTASFNMYYWLLPLLGM